MSIQERNRYNKEIEILRNRLFILQEQEKSYDDLSDEIKKKKKTLKKLDKEIDDRIYVKDIKDSEISDLRALLNILGSDKRQIEKEIADIKKNITKEKEWFAKERLVYENHLERISKSTNKADLKKEEFNKKLKEKKKEYEECVNKIKADKWDLFDKVLNNEKILEEQEKKVKKLEDKEKKLIKEIKELDKEYQKLLENYIIKQ